MGCNTELVTQLGDELHQSLKDSFPFGEVTRVDAVLTDSGVTLDAVTFSFNGAYMLMLNYNAVTKRMHIACGIALELHAVRGVQEWLLSTVLSVVQSYCAKPDFISKIVFRGFDSDVVDRCVTPLGYLIGRRKSCPVICVGKSS